MSNFVRIELEGGCYKKEFDSGTIRYYDSDGSFHRLDGPCCIYPDGDWFWCYHGKDHRWNGPAGYFNGEYEYWIMVKLYSKEEYEKIMLIELWKWLQDD